MLRSVFLLTALLHFYYTLYYDWFYIFPPGLFNDDISGFRPYKFKFLTFWNVILQAVFFTICLLADLIAGDKQTHVLRRLQNRMMVSLTYPLAMFVGLVFWAIYAVDRELILPKAFDAFFPTWLNHCMHTNIMVFMLIEFFTSNYTYAPRSQNLKILASVILMYLIWVNFLFVSSGNWVYPILTVLNWPLRVGFFALALFTSISLYFTGECLNKLIQKNGAQNAGKIASRKAK